MTPAPWAPAQPAPPPSLDRGEPNPQGGGRLTGDQTHRRRSSKQTPPSAATVRRRLVAVARDRLLELPAGGALAELWTNLEAGWWQCGWSALFRNADTGTVVGLPDHCDKIACPYCEMRRVGKVRDRYRERHEAALAEKRLYLVTCTVPNVPLGSLKSELARLRKAVARLRRRAWWVEAVAGGLWRLEVTVNLKARTWHPHVNLLFETHSPIRMADWQPRLQAEWRSVLGEDAAQWIYLVPGWAGSLRETIKHQVAIGADPDDLDLERDGATSIDYAMKPQVTPRWVDPSDPQWLVEYVEAVAGSRQVSSFGAWRKLPKPDRIAGEQLVPAPYVPGDHPALERFLPELDPVTATRASWQLYGRGPRWALRPVKPPGEGSREWLVWKPDDGTLDPSIADEDAPLLYQARMPLGPAADA